MTTAEKQFLKEMALYPVIELNKEKKPIREWKNPNGWINDPTAATGDTYGIITGKPSGIMVIDIDAKETTAEEKLEELKQAAKLTEDDLETINTTLRVITPNRGYHLYFKYREGLTNGSNVGLQAVDVRTQGGYIVSPHSRAKAKDGTIKQYEPSGDMIQEIPERLFDFLKNHKKKKDPTSNRAKVEGAGGAQHGGFSIEDLQGMKAGEGRNTALNNYLYAYCNTKGIKEEQSIIDLARGINDRFAEPEPGWKQTAESVHQALNDPEKEPFNDFLYRDENGRQRINEAYLAEYISQNNNLILVKQAGFENVLFYWYENGVYKRKSQNEIKTHINNYIPLKIRRDSMTTEVYRQLTTKPAALDIMDLNSEKGYINVKNGLVNVHTGKLEPHRPEVITTIQINAEYHEGDPIPEKWFNFLTTLTGGDMSMINVIQEWIGLTISNQPGHLPKKALALYGKVGNNGKTVLTNVMYHLIGEKNTAARDIQDLSNRFSAADLFGKKALIIDDQKGSDFSESSVFKEITSGGLVNCEFKGQQSFPFRFNGTVTFSCNTLPFIEGAKTSSLFERFMVIPCEVTIKEEDRDPMLFEDLKKESDQMFKWALEGLQRLIKNRFRFTHSAAIHEAGEDYRSKSDTLFRYVKETYTITGRDQDRITKHEFEQDYEIWAGQNDIKNPIEKKNIKDRAAAIEGIRYGKVSNNYYFGLERL